MDGFAPGAIWPAQDFDEVQIREVYSRYGLAMYIVQVLEHGMVNAAIVMRTLPNIRTHPNEASWQAAFDEAYETGLARTYGNMVRQLEEIDEFPRDLLELLKGAKEDRDILAHRFFRQNDIAFINRDGRTAMLAWCEERIEVFQSLSEQVDAFIAPLQRRHGISQVWIDRAIEQSMEDGRNWSPDSPPRP